MNVQSLGRGLLVAATLLVITTMAAAIVVMGTPAHQRALRLDLRRTSDLDRIVDTARAHAERTGALARDLTTLATQPGLRLSITDPETALPYEYKVQGARTFQVCATFVTDTAADDAGASRQEGWLHAVGRQCFDRTWELEAKRDQALAE